MNINWKKDVFTIPNLLSTLRLAMIPVYISIYLNAKELHEYITAAGILAASCLTDAVDGFIARKYNMISSLGKILDPLADKLTQLTLVICLSRKYPVLLPLVLLLLAKELFQLVGAILLLCTSTPLPSALPAGKASTVVLFGSLIGLILFPDIPIATVNILVILNSGCLIYAFVTYYHTFLALFSNQKRSPT